MIPVGVLNSSPLIALERISRLELIEQQFESVFVPEMVAIEVGNIPGWIKICRPQNHTAILLPSNIHPGEAAVLALAIEKQNAVLVLDDWYARRFAAERKFKVIGTVGLVVRAKRNKLIPLAMPVLHALEDVGFRISTRVMLEAKTLAGE